MPLMVIVRSAMPGSVAMGMCCAVVEDVLVDLVGDRQRVDSLAQLGDRSSSARVKTLPVGLCGVLTMMASRPRRRTRARSSSGSKRPVAAGSVTKRGTAPDRIASGP